MNKAFFRESDHTYWLGDKQLISVTQLIKKHGLSTDYSCINKKVLNKKSDRGSLIHKEIEEYIITGIMGFTTELEDYIRISNELEITPINAEQIVNNDIIAGTVDLQATRLKQELPCNGFIKILVDFKTGTTINKEACRWQLSLYERLIGEQFDELYIFHLGEKSKAIKVDRIPADELDKLIECERNGEIYAKREMVLAQDLLVEIKKVEQYIKDIDTQKKEAEATSEALKATLMEAMASQGIKSYETLDKSMQITYIEPTTRESIDSTRLKKELPDIAKKYLKVSNVKASVRITLRS